MKLSPSNVFVFIIIIVIIMILKTERRELDQKEEIK